MMRLKTGKCDARWVYHVRDREVDAEQALATMGQTISRGTSAPTEVPFEALIKLAQQNEEERLRFVNSLELVASADSMLGEEGARLTEVRMFLGV